MRHKIVILLTCALMALALSYAPALASGTQNAEGPSVSLTLHDALALALANNLTYQSAIADERIAEGKVVQARSGSLPSLGAGYSYQHTQNAGAFQFAGPPGPGGAPTIKQVLVSATDINNVNATLQYALYTGGATQAAIGQAAANLSATQSGLAAAHSNVIQQTTSAYFQLMQTKRTAIVADEAAVVASENLKTSRQLFDAGTAAKADVLRQEVSLADSRVNAIKAHNAAALANAQLANILNVNLGSVITPKDTLETQTPSFSLDTLLGDSQNRPELAAAYDAVTIADYAVKAARAGALPDVSLQLQDASSKPNFINVPQPQLSETLAVTWKLFDGGLTRGKVSEARAQVDKAKINLKQMSNSVDLEVRQAFLNYTAAQAQVDAARSAEVSAKENLRVSEIRYRAGVSTSLELSDALLSSTQAQNQYIDSLTALRISLVDLQRAAGIL